MPEAPDPGATTAPDTPPPARSERVLIVMILSEPSTFDEIVTTMLDVGLAGTVIESKGLMALIREEMPIFSGLASMLPQTTGTRVVMSIAKRETAQKFMGVLEEEFDSSDRPIAFSVAIDAIVGARN